MHGPEVECIGKGEARALRVRLQGQYRHPRDVAEGRAVRAPCQGAARQSLDGHTLGPVVADMEKLTGVEARRIHVDKGYRGHNLIVGIPKIKLQRGSAF